MGTLASRGWNQTKMSQEGAYGHVAVIEYQKLEGRLSCEVCVLTALSRLEGEGDLEWHTWVNATVKFGEEKEAVRPQLLLTAKEIDELLAEHRGHFPEYAKLPAYLYLPNLTGSQQKWTT
jgi:hypothetical protein